MGGGGGSNRRDALTVQGPRAGTRPRSVILLDLRVLSWSLGKPWAPFQRSAGG